MNRKKFGELIIRLRQTRNMKQKELADAMNVSTTAVSKWERGINYPDVESMEQLAEIFHLTIAELFEPEETLRKLLQGQLGQDIGSNPLSKEFPVNRPSEGSASVKRHLSRKTLLILIITGILLCVIGGILIYSHYRNDYSVRLVSQRAGEDPNYGSSYDLAFVVKGNVSIEKLKKLGEKYIPDIIESGLLPHGTKVYRFFYYTNEEDAISWKVTERYSILFP